MIVLIISIFVTICQTQVDTQLITSPPKLELESKPIVWYQVPNGGSAQRFELMCHASGDPEKYEWYKNGEPFAVDNDRVIWQKAGQSGTIVVLRPETTDQGFYQCRAINIFGVALSNIFEVRLGALDHFASGPMRQVVVQQGDSLTLPCKKPYGIPEPSIFWLFRNVKETFVIESINKPHITVDGDGNLQFSYVDLHDGRENLLYQCAATSPVLHGEYRAGDEFRLIVKQTYVQPRPPKKLWFSPSNLKVVANEPLKLTCIFDGYPLPEVKWSKHRGSLPVQRMSHENFGKTLVIKPLYPSDEGVYVCESGDIQHKMLVEIATAPQWIDGPPKSIDVPEEANVDLKCRAAGDPVPIVRWYKNGKPIGEPNGLHHHRRTVLHSGEILHISNVHHKTDRGVYQCNASNPLGYVFANAFLNVRAHAPVFETPIDQVVKAVLSTTIELDCAVQAAPLPIVFWTNQANRKIKEIGGQLEILKNHSLRIYSLKMTDSGEYFCNVSNKFGINKARRMLEVYTATILHTPLRPRSLTLDAGDDLQLSCRAEADLRLQIRYIWYRDGVALNFNADHSISRNVDGNRIKVLSVKGRHSGSYKCVAETDVDEVYSEMKLIVRDVPEAPLVIDIVCKETHAVIQWLPAYDNHAEISFYFVEYSTGFHPNVWKNVATISDIQNNTKQFETVVRLSPWVNYTFRVIAENAYGRGSPGLLPNAICVTVSSFPYDNPAKVSAAGTDRDNLIIRWTPMEKELWNAPGLYYIVRYRPEKPDTGSDGWFERRIEDPFLDHTEIRDLPTFTRFKVQVKAFNGVGESLEEPMTILGYSGEDVPFVAPKKFQVSELNATCANFTWEPVDENLVNGHLRGYRIKSWLINLDEDRSVSVLPEVVVYKMPTTALVEHFEPMQLYAAQVFALNTNFEGPPSEVVEFATPEGVPDPVENLTAEAYGTQTILIHWSLPLRARGYLKLYHIEYYEEEIFEEENGTRKTSESEVKYKNVYQAVVPVGIMHHLNDVAQPATNYTIFVWAETGGGEGPKTSVRLQTWNTTYPAKPSFTIEPFTSKSLLINWIPNRNGLPGSCFHVNFTRPKSPIWHTTETVYIPETSIIIDNLIADINYKFVLYAKDGDRSTSSDAKYAKIAPNKTLSEQVVKTSEGSLTGAAWFIAIICAVAVSLLSVVVICICHRNRGGKYPVKKKESERNECSEKDEKLLDYAGSGSSDLHCKGIVLQ